MEGRTLEVAGSAVCSEDEALLDRCRQRDPAALADLVGRYQDRVLNTCWRICGNRANAEDLSQEVFIRVLGALEGFRGASRLSTWIFRIAVNVAISARRRNRRAPTVSFSGSNPSEGDERTAPSARTIAVSDAEPDSQASSRERDAIVLRALDELDEEARTVVVLRDIESLYYEQIARILDVPVGTVKSRLHRARLALRDKLSSILTSV